MIDSPRALIADALVATVAEGKPLDACLDAARARNANPRSSAFIQESAYAVLRRYYELESLLNRFLARPLRSRDVVIKMLLMAGLNELYFMKTPGHAVVDESVAACSAIGREWAKGVVNGILRSAAKAQPVPNSREVSPEIRWNHPQWLIDAFARDWPEFKEQILYANNQRPPLTIRVNCAQTSRENFLRLLSKHGLSAQPTRHAASGIRLSVPCPIADLPGFADGLMSVQDEAAQLAAPLLECRPQHRVLDACAAPGGKTAHLLELYRNLVLTAVDIKQQRMTNIVENLARLGLSCTVRNVDASALQSEASAPTYDRILLDAPCSATGVIRRHPDIKIHRKPEDLKRVIERQAQLLHSLWPLLIPDGVLLYATCSILHAENDGVIGRFLDAQAGAAQVNWIEGNWGHPTRFGRQILPGEDDMDGFYYARITKRCGSP